MNWQPIETAPKDEDVLIFRSSGRICIAKFDRQPFHAKPLPFWNDYGVFGVHRMRQDAPTHWMPLPPAPRALSEHAPAEETKGALRILDCYSSPFPDAIERRKRAEQSAFVAKLQKEISDATQ